MEEGGGDIEAERDGSVGRESGGEGERERQVYRERWVKQTERDAKRERQRQMERENGKIGIDRRQTEKSKSLVHRCVESKIKTV